MDTFLEAVAEKAKKALVADGIPIGFVPVCDGNMIGRGHRPHVQNGSVIHHAEINGLENAGRQNASI